MPEKSNAEVLLSPEGLIVLPFAVLIDLIGIILVCFALDDFWITDIIAWTGFGIWGLLRSQLTPPEEKSDEDEEGEREEAPTSAQLPAAYDYFQQKKRFKEKMGKFDKAIESATQKAQEAARAAQTAQQAGNVEKVVQETKRVQKFSRAARVAKNLKWLEFIPYVGCLPLWTISVYATIKYS